MNNKRKMIIFHIQCVNCQLNLHISLNEKQSFLITKSQISIIENFYFNNQQLRFFILILLRIFCKFEIY